MIRISLRNVPRTLALAGSVLALGACASITPLTPLARSGGGSPSLESSGLAAADIEYFGANPLMVPVAGITPARVPDSFREPRDGGRRVHRASDILAPRGTPVLAAEGGRIIRASQNALGGLTIYAVDDAGRFIYYYAHMDRYSGLAAAGRRIARGDVLGYVGSSGNASGGVTHLHFQVMRREPARRDYWNGTPVDVREFFTMAGARRTDEGKGEGERASRASR